LQILDKPRKKIVKIFEGNGLNIFEPIYWDGKDSKGKLIDVNWPHQYMLRVEDSKGHYDEISAKDIVFKKFDNEEDLKKHIEEKEKDKDRRIKWLDEQDNINNLAIQNINIQGETIVVDKLNAKIKSVSIMRNGTLFADVPVVESKMLTAKDLIEGKKDDFLYTKSRLDIILPNGDYEVLIQEETGKEQIKKESVEEEKGISSEAIEMPSRQLNTYSKKISVGGDYLFFVGLGDAEVGYRVNSGDIEPVENDVNFKKGFYTEGKMAYYLKGKIKGKYLITSSFDTDRKQKEIFKHIDPDEYYPIYGDQSKVDYRATATQGPLYLLIEWDKSSALWGNYDVSFSDTEFGKFSRSLYGAKVDFETLSRTKYGEPTSKAVLFRAQAQQKAAHVEYLATGGSLYYLKNADIIDGSDKVKIQVRDKITGLTISEREMKEGADYELDYKSGRMVFWLPVPMIVQSYSIVSDALLDGNQVYVIADYEYEVNDKTNEANMGVRIKQSLGDNVNVGYTAVRESQTSADYNLEASDLTIHLGKDAKVVAEYAQSESQSMGIFVSNDGGLSFTELSTPSGAKGKAYGIRGDAQLFNRLAIQSYYKWIDDNFSTTSTSSQQGKELVGIEAILDITEKTRLIARHDIQTLIDDGNLQTQLQLGAVRTATSLMQFVQELKKLRLTGEYSKKKVEERLNQFDSLTAKENDTIAARAEYQLTDKINLSVEQQRVLTGEGSNQTTFGATATPIDKVTLSAQQVVGDSGTATSLSAAADMNEKFRLTGGYTIAQDIEGNKTSTTVLESGSNVGMQYKFDEDTTMRTALGVSGALDGSHATSVTLGGSKKVDADTDLDTEFVLTDSNSGGKSKAYTFGSKRKIADDLKLGTSQSFETRADGYTTGSGYSLIREKDGRSLEGSLTRAYSEGKQDVSNSNIFGLSGDINDKWAVVGLYEKGDVTSFSGSKSTRDVVSVSAGYVDQNEQTGKNLKSSTKLEMRLDKGDTDKRQYLVSNATEGKV
ncbi:MAG: hypothetical protein HQL27_09780, partial [Candidatus Omnitrophica bacterium]|nr:hypothetical protein [Candidatus Omnitrophota bacterium]